MEVGRTLYITDRDQWRSWLADHHDREKEIWLIYYKKGSGQPRIPYNDAVEEALCYGWIDSIVKGIDEERYTQRFTPRRPKSNLSEMNKVRVRRLIVEERMTEAGLAAIRHAFDEDEQLTVAPDILQALQQDAETWKNFQGFLDSYKRIRVGFIEGARTRPEVFQQRLHHFLKMTAQNKRYGMVQ
ncbi:MAG: hypothetical protein CL878_03985 [Dehalococcoidia bacterium]|nr:hypothetical protein [Dehalococcoidia bacterium]